MSKQRKRGESHVRMYAHEMRTPAWQSLSVDAKALLIELRALYRPSAGNTVFLSCRQAMQRLHIGQRRAQRAFTDLIERGWVSVATPGGFNRKTRHATSYRLENESTGAPNSIPRKEYMRWQPDEKSR